MNILNRRLIRILFITAVWMVGIGSLIFRSVRDVNPHHDGVVLAPAIAVARGKTPNLDVFSQYGFLIPYIQGIWLKMTTVNLISLRFFTLLQIVITAIILSLILKRRTGGLIATLICVSWAISYPHLLPFLPWPSVTSTLFIVSAIWALSMNEARNTGKTKYIFIAYSFLSLASLIRPQSAISLLLVAFYLITDSNKSISAYFRRAALLFIFPLLIALFTFKVGLLPAYLDQSIFWAGSKYGGLGFSLRGLAELLLVPIVGGLSLLGLRLTLAPSKRFAAVAYWITAASVGILLLTFFSWQYSNYPYFALKHPKVLFSDLGINVLNALSFTSFLTVAAGVFIRASSQIRNLKMKFDSETLILVVSSLSIFQLYPASDPLHFWYLAPIFVLGTFSAFKGVHCSPKNRKVMVLALSLYIGICSIDFIHYQSIRHVNYQSQILQGMSGSEFEVSYIDKSMTILQSLPENSSIKFDCDDGIYSVATGKYLAKDRNFVNWAPNYDVSDFNFDYIFQCNVVKESSAPEGFYVGKAIPIRLGASGLQNGLENRLLIKSKMEGKKW